MARTVVALDFETSGYKADCACALGMVRIQDGRIENSLYRLIRPPSPRVLFTNIHGLDWQTLKTQPGFSELWPEFSAFLHGADFLVAHNASFDRRILYGCCHACGVSAPSMPFLCTLRGSRRRFHLPHCRLNDVCDFLNIPLHHHNAASDALAAATIYLRLTESGMDPEEMLL